MYVVSVGELICYGKYSNVVFIDVIKLGTLHLITGEIYGVLHFLFMN